MGLGRGGALWAAAGLFWAYLGSGPCTWPSGVDHLVLLGMPANKGLVRVNDDGANEGTGATQGQDDRSNDR